MQAKRSDVKHWFSKVNNMNDLVNIQLQIEKLQKQAQQIKLKEFDKTVREIQAKMRAFGISLKDLQAANSGKSAKRIEQFGTTRKKSRKVASSVVGSKVEPKYRGTEGQSWSGRGLMPRWLKALVAAGHAKEEFLINKPSV